MTDSQRWLFVASILLLGGLVYLLSPVLIPFLIASIIAYFFNPVVSKLTSWHIPRVLSVTIVFLFFLILLIALIFLFIPVLESQIRVLIKLIPEMNKWFMTVVLPKFDRYFHFKDIDLTAMEGSLLTYLEKGSGVVAKIWGTVSTSGLAFVSFFVNLGLILVVSFYLLCDWKDVSQSVIDLFPRAYETKIVSTMRECGAVLAAFFRGQLLVMVGLGFIYSIGLWAVGINVGILIGFLAGLLSIVPYLGFIIGIILAIIASAIQYHDWVHLVWIVAVFGVGELAESFLLVPFLVGDRVGLHPVAVIFAVLAGGQLFGFAGVLLAVPVSAVIVVLLRHVRGRYVKSHYYDRSKEQS